MLHVRVYVLRTVAARLSTINPQKYFHFQANNLRSFPLIPKVHAGIRLGWPASQILSRRHASIEASDLRKGDIIEYKGKRQGS
jgi:hypothetical protein